MKAPLLFLLATTLLASAEAPWIPLFNGKDLSGWTTKIRHHPLGENFANTFTVEDGIIKVSYDGYGKFASSSATSTRMSRIPITYSAWSIASRER
ncbi:MAG: DUF1080 domain-containing protein [Luteolibacter sp.]